jgi:hypothetical protein
MNDPGHWDTKGKFHPDPVPPKPPPPRAPVVVCKPEGVLFQIFMWALVFAMGFALMGLAAILL